MKLFLIIFCSSFLFSWNVDAGNSDPNLEPVLGFLYVDPEFEKAIHDLRIQREDLAGVHLGQAEMTEPIGPHQDRIIKIEVVFRDFSGQKLLGHLNFTLPLAFGISPLFKYNGFIPVQNECSQLLSD